MKFLLANTWVLVILVSICAFTIVYVWADKALDWLEKKTVGEREALLKLLRLMQVDTTEKQITTFMLLLSFGLGTLVFFLFLPNVIGGLVIGAMVTVAGWNLPMMIVKYMYQKRCGLFVDQMIDGLTIMANGIKAGNTPVQGLERVAENLGNPISQEFKLVLQQIKLGRSLEEALIELGERVPRPDVQMFVTAVNILKETGGNLGETFQTIVMTIRERQKIEKKIEAMTAQGIAQGTIITLVPLVLILIFLGLDPAFVKPMFSTPLGLVFLVIMFALQIIGGISIRKIVKIKV